MSNHDENAPATKAAHTAKWANTMAKVRIRRAVAKKRFPQWHIIDFVGPNGAESRGIVDLIAVRKNHATPRHELKRGDALQIILIQVKGGSAAYPTIEDAKRLRIVCKMHGADNALLATWKKGTEAQFYELTRKARVGATGRSNWREVSSLEDIFGDANS